MICWDAIDTVLLDMDGTLLDLAYDNVLWTRLLPRRFSQARKLSLEQAETYLFQQMKQHKGKLRFYCLDYWAEFTGLDIMGLHRELAHLIVYRPWAREFLDHLRTLEQRALLVTNAHRDSLAVKDEHAQLCNRLDAVISCHDYGAPKESREFWDQLLAHHPFDPARTLLIDDNVAVLDAAAGFGIAHLLTIAQPDSQRPPRIVSDHPAIHDFRQLIDPGMSSPQRKATP